jgi:hypothetical protein
MWKALSDLTMVQSVFFLDHSIKIDAGRHLYLLAKLRIVGNKSKLFFLELQMIANSVCMNCLVNAKMCMHMTSVFSSGFEENPMSVMQDTFYRC